MIRAIILDVDGVLVGEKIGFNSPYPHPDVLARLKEIREKGIPIILCGAKPSYALSEIITKSHLDNPHITDAGALIIDPIAHKIIKKHTIEKSLAKEVLQLCLDHHVYVEFYALNDYFIDEKEVNDITAKRTHIVQREPKKVADLVSASLSEDILRIAPIARDEEDRKRVDELLAPYKQKLSIGWGVHPVALPLQFGMVNALNSSKKEAAQAVIHNLDISFEEVLGVGDSASDWSFMQLCGYTATLENGSKDIKELVATKGEGRFFIAPHVDENGILNIFAHFGL